MVLFQAREVDFRVIPTTLLPMLYYSQENSYLYNNKYNIQYSSFSTLY